jgi:uncharacterized membrane protein YdbT with pleckstrin-like domain
LRRIKGIGAREGSMAHLREIGMRYIETSLAPGEAIRFSGRLHWILWTRAWLALVFLGVVLVGIFIFVHDLIVLNTTEIAITSRRLILKRGLVGRQVSELELSTVEAVKLDQDVLGRILGWGRLEVHGTGDDVWRSPLIADPIRFRKELEAALIALATPARSAA